MKTAVWPSSFAKDEIRYYIRWYESESAGLGDGLWSEIQNVMNLISEYPSIGEAVRRTAGKVRRVPLRHFPFFVIYRQQDDGLQIVALAHTSRKPNYWRSRLKAE
ncbi:MAG: type II toxin-antitoxin system RelE/ParE family toxin [Thermoanaerobaculia bacterium]